MYTKIVNTAGLMLLITLVSCGIFRQPVLVDFAITQTDEYCGGAPPPEELQEELATPRSMPAQSLYISAEGKESGMNLKVVEGKATANLKPGKYTVRLYSDKQIDAFIEKYKIEEGVQECYKDWMNRPVAEFEVKKDLSVVEFNVHITCDPCAPVPP